MGRRSRSRLAALPEFDGFDWDHGNTEKNWAAHRVTPQEAEQILFNTPLISADDKQHSRTTAPG
ncbi:MAG: BrnT family toxin [Spirochaetaceae bacterium]|nr:BrnT family toxin [Spirochaetaceae bacterium]